MKYEEQGNLIVIDPENLADKMKLEEFLDGFDQIKPGFMESMRDSEADDIQEIVQDALEYVQEAIEKLNSAENELDQIA